MIKKITTLVSTNRQVIARKALIIGGVALGIVAGALLVKPEEETLIVVGETVEEETTTEESTPEN
jgi:hypothetical protein